MRSHSSKQGDVAGRYNPAQQCIVPITAVSSTIVSPQISSCLVIKSKVAINMNWETCFKGQREKAEGLWLAGFAVR